MRSSLTPDYLSKIWQPRMHGRSYTAALSSVPGGGGRHRHITSFSISSICVNTSHYYTRSCTKTTLMDNSGKEKEAIQLMAEADKKVKSSGSFLGGMFGWGWCREQASTHAKNGISMMPLPMLWHSLVIEPTGSAPDPTPNAWAAKRHALCCLTKIILLLLTHAFPCQCLMSMSVLQMSDIYGKYNASTG